LFDLRAPTATPPEIFGMLTFIFESAEFPRHLIAKPVKVPGERRRIHSGFAPEWGNTSGGYFSGFEVMDGRRIDPAGAKDLPVIFLVNSNSEIPPLAVGLQTAGKAAILAEGQINDAPVVSTQALDLGDVKVRVRLGELVYEDGSGGIRVDGTFAAATP